MIRTCKLESEAPEGAARSYCCALYASKVNFNNGTVNTGNYAPLDQVMTSDPTPLITGIQIRGLD